VFDLDQIGGPRALGALVSEILAAGEEALALFRSGAGDRAERKGDDSPVTEADKRVEQRLRAFLAARFPTCGFLGEESGESAGAQATSRFIVDPIDGTRAFMRGLDTWSILVGLEHEGTPVLGVAYLPAAEELFVGVVGEGATHDGRPVQLSRVAKLADALVAHGALAQFAGDAGLEMLRRLARASYTQRGPADFGGYRALLLGQADAVVDPGLAPWDMCAPAAIVRAAGGRFTSLRGEPTIYGGGAIASNGLVHDELVALFADLA
jgi:histidinol phosphatase-like enzyme (inositol monophosphatase family)